MFADIFSTITDFPAFLVAATLFAMIPGLDTVFVINKALSQGRLPSLASAMGINAGVLVHTAIGALGLSAVIAASATAYTVIKWMGAAYLIYLGIKALISKVKPVGNLHVDGNAEPLYKSFVSGVIANVLNPKVALFVLAFFPQFISHEAASSPLPFCILGITYALIGCLWYTLLALFASTLGSLIMKKQSSAAIMQRLSGAVFVLMGIRVAVQ